jgi:DNA-binding response OmpR family regulator
MAVLSNFGEPHFDRVRFVMGDAGGDASAGVINSLQDRGLSRTLRCGTTDQLYDALDAEIVDVLMYDYDLLGPDFVDVMQSIRRKQRGRNPFLIIVATVRDSAFDTVRRLISAGVDDLIRKPVSVDRVFGSLNAFAVKRKPFTASYSYIGPTRRMTRRAGEAPSQLIRVPNTLRSRAIEGVSDAELEQMVSTAVAVLSDKRIESYGIELNLMCGRVAEIYAGAAESHEDQLEVRTTLNRMELVADDLRNNCRETPFSRVADLATMLIAISQRVSRKPVGKALVEVQLLDKLALAIRRALSTERQSVNVMQEITSIVANYTRLN